MGIQVEFNPDLALRNITEFVQGRRKLEECIPKILKCGEVYDFLKLGQRNFYLLEEVPYRETEGNQKLSDPLASVIILEATHFAENGRVYTRGKYRVVDIFNPKDPRPHFNGHERIRHPGELLLEQRVS